MTRSKSHPVQEHFIVDGSNLATEGRALPSLTQLNEAVLAFMADHPGALITVVVDATFGHRIDKAEVKAFDEAVANNELVTPPAGAVGRGDAFVLQIAHKANAGILSNDSFQEFHGEYPWLFDEGRLIGGKPVPHVGWVFVERLPVRGAKSRQSVKQSSGRQRVAKSSGSPLADQPMPVPSTPPPGKAGRAPHQAPTPKPASEPSSTGSSPPARAAKPAGGTAPVNEWVPFLDFVERHPVGTSCTVVVESYASHGAYARAGEVLVYLPLRLMGDPVPRSARSAVSIGEAVAVVIAGYVPERRSIDAALPSAVAAHPALAEAVAAAGKPAKPARTRTKKAAATPAVMLGEPIAVTADEPPAAPTGRRRRSRPAVASEVEPVTPAEPAAPTADQPPPSRRRRTPALVAAGPVPPAAGEPSSPPTKRPAARLKQTQPADATPARSRRAKQPAAAAAAVEPAVKTAPSPKPKSKSKSASKPEPEPAPAPAAAPGAARPRRSRRGAKPST